MTSLDAESDWFAKRRMNQSEGNEFCNEGERLRMAFLTMKCLAAYRTLKAKNKSKESIAETIVKCYQATKFYW